MSGAGSTGYNLEANYVTVDQRYSMDLGQRRRQFTADEAAIIIQNYDSDDPGDDDDDYQLPIEAVVAESASDTEDDEEDDSDSEATVDPEPLIAAPSGRQWRRIAVHDNTQPGIELLSEISCSTTQVSFRLYTPNLLRNRSKFSSKT